METGIFPQVRLVVTNQVFDQPALAVEFLNLAFRRPLRGDGGDLGFQKEPDFKHVKDHVVGDVREREPQRVLRNAVFERDECPRALAYVQDVAGDQFPDRFPNGPSAYMKLLREFILVGKPLPGLQMLVPDELEQVIYGLFGLALVVLIHISTPCKPSYRISLQKSTNWYDEFLEIQEFILCRSHKNNPVLMGKMPFFSNYLNFELTFIWPKTYDEFAKCERIEIEGGTNMKNHPIRRGLAFVMLLCFCLSVLTGCQNVPGENEPLTFRMAVVDGEQSPVYQGAVAMADAVERETMGRIKVVVVSGGALGDERGSVELCHSGDIDIASAANSVLTNFIPEMNILDQPYLWETEEQAHAAIDGPVGDLIEDAAYQKLHVHVIGYLESGFRDTFSKKPIRSIADFKGIKIRTMQNSYHMAAFSSFGAMPTAMAYSEVFTALQQGTIDACENAVSNCLSNGYYEVTKHITFTHHAFTYIPVMMSDTAWNLIPEDLREPFLRGCYEGYQTERKLLKEANEDAVLELKKKGVEFHEIDRTALRQSYEKAAAAAGYRFDPAWQAAVDEVLSTSHGGETT